MRCLLLLLAAPALLSATAPADRLGEARAEAAAAEREVERLSAAARAAQSEAARFQVAQAAAAASILAAEARISAAEEHARRTSRLLAQRRAELLREQRPASLLLAGLAQMSRRPPLLAIANGGSLDEFVRVRALLDTTLPAIRARTAALSHDLRKSEALAREAKTAQDDLARRRNDLRASQQRFAGLEQQALTRSAALGSQAFAAGDVAIARSNEAAELGGRSGRNRSAARMAAALARLDSAPASPRRGRAEPAVPPLDYQLPVESRVLTGLSEISPNGVRSRGLLLDSNRGEQVVAPADGRIAFAGPFRSRDGVIVIDHGGGWMTLLTEVRTTLRTGERIARGAPLGRALGDVTVELRFNGRPQPAALIARSSASLSNTADSG